MSIDAQRIAPSRYKPQIDAYQQLYARRLREVVDIVAADGGLRIGEEPVDDPRKQYVQLVRGVMSGDPEFQTPAAMEAMQQFEQEFGLLNPAEVM